MKKSGFLAANICLLAMGCSQNSTQEQSIPAQTLRTALNEKLECDPPEIVLGGSTKIQECRLANPVLLSETAINAEAAYFSPLPFDFSPPFKLADGHRFFYVNCRSISAKGGIQVDVLLRGEMPDQDIQDIFSHLKDSRELNSAGEIGTLLTAKADRFAIHEVSLLIKEQ